MSDPTSFGALPRDDNDVAVAGAVNDNAGAAIVPWKVNPNTGRLLISAVLSGHGTPVNNEVVSGSGTTWTLAHIPLVGIQHIYANGQRLTPGGVDYTISGATITTIVSFVAGTVLADYEY